MALRANSVVVKYLPIAVLPSIHLLLVVFTMTVSATQAGGAYYRIFGVDPLAASVGMVYEGPIFYATLLIFGTAWWWFVAYCGWKTKDRGGWAVLSVLVSLLSVSVVVALTVAPLREDALSVAALLQYLGVGTLCLGTLIIGASSAKAVLVRRREPRSS